MTLVPDASRAELAVRLALVLEELPLRRPEALEAMLLEDSAVDDVFATRDDLARALLVWAEARPRTTRDGASVAR